MVDRVSTANSERMTESATERRDLVLHRKARIFVYVYSGVLLIVLGAQTLCLFLLWRPAQAWVTFGAQFVTSPAIAGLFALTAAIIGAWQISKQLAYTKQKAAAEAWWQQFEWVTDRIISSQKKNPARIPASLAFSLMTSLSKTATEPFQESAVEGIIIHYLSEFEKQNDGSVGQSDKSVPDAAGTMDAAGAESLRNLLDALPTRPATTGLRESARRFLQTFDYEAEVMAALRHQGIEVSPSHAKMDAGYDAIISFGKTKAALIIKVAITRSSSLFLASEYLQKSVAQAQVACGIIVSPPTDYGSSPSSRMPPGIHLIEWEPSLGSFELARSIKNLLREKDD